MHDGIDRVLTKMRYVPELKRNLISLGTLDSQGYSFKSGARSISVSKGSLVVMKAVKRNLLYVLQGETIIESTTSIQEQHVLPIGHLICYCEASWKKILCDWNNSADSCGSICSKKIVSCCGRFYAQSIRKVIHTEDVGVLVVGTLKISLSSGILQLVDATGGMDVVLDVPVLSVVWEIGRILEAKDFTIIIEGKPEKLVGLDLHPEQSLSCRSIFGA
ncbi:uncharacterized protein [Henckelia pumila]|uniref:uncharacterized protein n=1 Tax=Henckelia pumila TaxID=405737 RepID=UPI003C6DD2C2